MTKQDIREKHLRLNGLSVNKSPIGKQIQKAAYDAMDEYAKEFYMWAVKRAFNLTEKETLTVNQLIELFNSQPKKNQQP